MHAGVQVHQQVRIQMMALWPGMLQDTSTKGALSLLVNLSCIVGACIWGLHKEFGHGLNLT